MLKWGIIIIRHHAIISLEKLLVSSSKIFIKLQADFPLFLTFQVFFKTTWLISCSKFNFGFMTNLLSFWFFLLTVVLKLKNYHFNKRLYIRIIVSLAILGFSSACLGRRHIFVQLIYVVFGILTFLFFFP